MIKKIIEEKFEDKPKIRRNKRIRKVTYLEDDYFIYLVDDDHKNYKEVMWFSNTIFWQEAIDSEVESLMVNHSWELVELPKGTESISCKWVFTKKLKLDGTIDKFKSRLVALVCEYEANVNYFDTYIPVMRITTIKVLFVIATIHKLIIHQLDVKQHFWMGI